MLERPTEDRQTLLARVDYHRGEISKHQHALAAALEGLGKPTIERRLSKADWLREPIAALGLPMRVMNYLLEVGVYNVADLLNTPRETLLAIPGFGQGYLTEAVKALEAIGFVQGAAE